MSQVDVALGLLRAAVKSGEVAELAAAYADDAVLEASLPGKRDRAASPAERQAVLARAWGQPAELVEWAPAAFAEGAAVWLERVAGDGGAVRQRHYLHVRDGRISRHWVYAAPPRSTAPRVDREPPPRLFARLGVAEREPLVSTGWSGNRLERLRLRDGRLLIAKRVVLAGDWIGRASHDRGREGLLFSEGLFDRMPALIDHALVAAEPDGEAWWIVMRDVSDALLDADSPITREQHRFAMRAAAAMWEEFEGADHSFLCSLEDRLTMGGTKIAEIERDGFDLLPKQFEACWEAFAEAVEPDVADPVLALLEDPAPLARELRARGTTLIHGDLRDEQIGFADDRLVALDWGLATQGHPVVELAWYMGHDVWRIEASHDEVVEDFRRARGERDDPYALELGMIAGLMMYGWVFGHSAVVHPDPAEREWARGELGWWVPRVRRALEQWSP